MATKEVRFDLYCRSCVNKDTPEKDEPCSECLSQGWNDDSRKPIRYTPKPS